MEPISGLGTKLAAEGRGLSKVAEFLKSQALRGGIFFFSAAHNNLLPGSWTLTAQDVEFTLKCKSRGKSDIDVAD